MCNTEFDISILMMWQNKKLFVNDKNEGDSNSEPPKNKDVQTHLKQCVCTYMVYGQLDTLSLLYIMNS